MPRSVAGREVIEFGDVRRVVGGLHGARCITRLRYRPVVKPEDGLHIWLDVARNEQGTLPASKGDGVGLEIVEHRTERLLHARSRTRQLDDPARRIHIRYGQIVCGGKGPNCRDRFGARTIRLGEYLAIHVGAGVGQLRRSCQHGCGVERRLALQDDGDVNGCRSVGAPDETRSGRGVPIATGKNYFGCHVRYLGEKLE